MSNLEIDRFRPEATGLFVPPSREARLYTKSIMQLMDMVFCDSGGRTVLEAPQRTERRVAHSTSPDTTLVVARGNDIFVEPDSFDKPNSGRREGCVQFSQMGVEEDGMTFMLTLEHRLIQAVDLRGDAVTQVIVDSFRSHLQHPAPPTTP